MVKADEAKVDLVGLSIKQNDALTVLLTGRGEQNFADLIKRIVASKKLPFDMICLKPQAGPHNERFRSTMMYKQAILEDLVFTYKLAVEIRIYEDRLKQYVILCLLLYGVLSTILVPKVFGTSLKALTPIFSPQHRNFLENP